MTLGTQTNPLRVAIIGSGPSAFYAAEALQKRKELVVQMDMFERLPTPFGLVRGGVAPDHDKIKSVTKVYDRIAANPNFRFYGNVEFGKDITQADLATHYHQIVYATGAQTDKRMEIPGEDLAGSHPATEFVGWYNAHPDYRDLSFDLSQERVAVVGNGNVAMDVIRILARTPEELYSTDIADYALEALRHSRVKEIYVLGRRGPAQAAYTNPEIKELGELADAEVVVSLEDATLDPLSRAYLDANRDPIAEKNVQILARYAQQPPQGKSRKIYMHFLVSPVEIIGTDGVEAIKIVKNELVGKDGSLRPRPTGAYETIPVGLVFRSIGYYGVPLPGVVFDERSGTIPNQVGRVLDPASGQPVTGEYVVGWIKRGPSGVIGTNKPDAYETVNAMLEDAASGRSLNPAEPSPAAFERLLAERQPNYVSFADWQILDQIELAQGSAQGRTRLKFTRVADMLAALTEHRRAETVERQAGD